jgi:aspartate ammonia-lyase
VSATIAAARVEHDLLGEYPIPVDALYGVHTARALENFPPLGPRLADVVELCSAFGMVKLAASRANLACGQLDIEVAGAITTACQELIDGSPQLRSNLLVPLLQGGAGTSTNMNVNEVLANRSLQHLGCAPGEYARCHPNDHVNRSQSTNDVYPTALRVALLLRHRTLVRRLNLLVEVLGEARERFDQIPKLARTQLRDAVPMTVGDEFAAWKDGCQSALEGIERGTSALLAVNLGGTAVGTGLTAPRDFAELAVAHLSSISGLAIRRAASAISATTDATGFLGYSSAMRMAAVPLAKLANDLRLLSSGPRAGFGELALPAVQAGSSMMPGKVNPVIPEYANQVAFRIHGLDMTVTMALDAAQLQLNAMLPVVAGSMFEAQELLGLATEVLAHRCIAGVEVNEARTRGYAAEGLGKATVLASELGYDASSELAMRAERAGTAPDAAVERQTQE